MSTVSPEEILNQIRHLPLIDQLRLLEDLAALVRQHVSTSYQPQMNVQPPQVKESPQKRFNPQKLRELRRSRDITQKELATTIKLKQEYISTYERGLKVPGINTLAAISEVFGVPIDYFFEGETYTK
jgi:DNA-binding XRE family transcriptional regulator